ncbi:MAG: DUF748 domain-containing protein [Burkholderiaceae bacterium]
MPSLRPPSRPPTRLSGRLPTRLLVPLLVLACLLLGAVGAYRVAVERLNTALRQALGPRATVGAVELGWAGLVVRDLHVAAGPGWPADEELHAGTVRVRPDLASAFGGAWRVQRIEVEDARIVLLRTRDGRLRVLPSMLEPAPGAASSAAASAPAPVPATRVLIDHVVLHRVQVDLHDASLHLPRPHLVRLTDLEATLDTLALPALDQAMQIELAATVKGPSHDGRVALAGTLTPATREARLTAEMNGVDLLALQPYLLKVADGGIRQGRLDLSLQATVHDQQLKAPGRVTLTGLELAEGSGLLGRMGGLSRQAALAALKRHDRIALAFTLEGRLDDPGFSVNDSLALRFATGLAEALGVSIEGVVEGVGKVFKGLLGH